MYHASTVLTGSEIPALSSIRSWAAAGRQQTRTRAATAQTRTPRAWVFVGIATPFAILFHAPPTAETQNSRNSRPNPAMRSLTPQRRSASHTIAWCAAMTIGLAQLVGLRHHHLLAAERLGGSRLRRRAGRDLDLQLGLEVADHPLRVGITLRQVDGDAAEYDDVYAGRRHLARGLHADVVGLLDLALAAHYDRQRGDDERHAGGNDLVELIGKDLGGGRRRGVADARPMPVDVRTRHRG